MSPEAEMSLLREADRAQSVARAKRLPTNKELGIKPTKADHAAADEIVLSGRMKTGEDFNRECLTEAAVEPFLEKPFPANPKVLVVNGLGGGYGIQRLKFVDRTGNCQKCSDCWFHWFDTNLCQEAPCNSQGRTDGRRGTWQEEGR